MMSADQTNHQKRIEPISHACRFFITFIILSCIVIFLASMFFILILNTPLGHFFHQTSASQSVSAPNQYPAFLVSTPPETPQSTFPYTSQTVFKAFRTADKDISGIIYSYGWSCCVTYQPEGKLIGWQESYGVQLEVATFATSAEAKTDASDLLKHSVGYSVLTRNLCLFFYDRSISKALLAHYSAVLLTVCS